jgi:PHP family Zn ribbon phosphoesterase
MNWRLDQLKNITIVSNSDAHSPRKLGREANIIESKLDYREIIGAVRANDKRFIGTIEFYPEEGKYHVDGHSKCGFYCDAEKTKKLKGICPKCGKPLVIGVDYRVNEIADQKYDYKPQKHKTVEYIIPLAEMIAEAKGVKSTNAKSVQEEYEKMILKLGDEFSILRSVPAKEIKGAGFELISEGIDRMRQGHVTRIPGYDGIYGIIKVFDENARKQGSAQVGMEI